MFIFTIILIVFSLPFVLVAIRALNAVKNVDNASREEVEKLAYQYRLGEKLAGRDDLLIPSDSLFSPENKENPLLQIDSLIRERNYTEALSIANQAKSKMGVFPFLSRLAFCYNALGKYEMTLQVADNAYAQIKDSFRAKDMTLDERFVNFIGTFIGTGKLTQKPYTIPQEQLDKLYTYCQIYKIEAYKKLGDFNNARSTAYHCMASGSDLIIDGEKSSIKDLATEAFYSINKEYCSRFLEIPVYARRVIMPVKAYTVVPKEMVAVIKMEDLPMDIKFKEDPLPDHLYVKHPAFNDFYIPFENHEVELLRDKLQEYCRLVQCLGASKIIISCENKDKDSRNEETTAHVEAEGSKLKMKGNAKVDIKTSSDLLNELNQKLSLEQSFSPTKLLPIPENLIWYPKQYDWQEHYKQRMCTNDINSWDEVMETSKTNVVNVDELYTLQAEFAAVISKGSASAELHHNLHVESHEESLLKVHVEFVPKSELNS